MEISPSNKTQKWKGFFLFLCGFFMGAADLIPGISGGTIAFIMGFYDPLLQSIQTLNSHALKLLLQGKFRQFSQVVAWRFLLFLFLGMLASFITLASVFHKILSHEWYRVYLYSIFLGLILASFLIYVRRLKQWAARHVIGLIFGVAIAYLLTGTLVISEVQGEYSIKVYLNEHFPSLTNYDAKSQQLTNLSISTLGVMLAKGMITEEALVYDTQGNIEGTVKEIAPVYRNHKIDTWLIFCGALAVCALLLPGLSGSYILVLLGVYPIVIGALSDLIEGFHHLTLNEEAFYTLSSLAVGIIVGMLVFARIVSRLLKSYPHSTTAILSGFMIGALRSVWPFWSYEYALLPLKLDKGPQLLLLDPILPPIYSPLFLYAMAYAACGFAFVFLIEYLAMPHNRLHKEKVHELEL